MRRNLFCLLSLIDDIKKNLARLFDYHCPPLDRQCTHRGVHRDSTREIPLKNVVSSFGLKFSLLMVLEIHESAVKM